MNWSKGVNKLIILFLSINILLGWANYRKDTGAYVLKDKQVENIINVLEKNNIIIDSDLPLNYRPMKNLKVMPHEITGDERKEIVESFLGSLDSVKISLEAQKYKNLSPKRIYKKDKEELIFDGNLISYINQDNKTFKKNISISQQDIEKAEKLSLDWLGAMGIKARKKYIQVFEEDKGLINIIYYDKYEGFPVFDSYIKFTVTPRGISEIHMNKVELDETTGDNSPIYSADQICFYLMQEIPTDKPIHIRDIVIGYVLENPKGRHLISEEALPFYQVTLENGSIYYINAYNSELRQEPNM